MSLVELDVGPTSLGFDFLSDFCFSASSISISRELNWLTWDSRALMVFVCSRMESWSWWRSYSACWGLDSFASFRESFTMAMFWVFFPHPTTTIDNKTVMYNCFICGGNVISLENEVNTELFIEIDSYYRDWQFARLTWWVHGISCILKESWQSNQTTITDAFLRFFF